MPPHLFADEDVADAEVLYALTDHQGSVRDLAVYDSQNDVTTIANHRVYGGYGNVQSETNSAVDCLFGYTGRLFDEANALQNNLNRWYDASVGRWMSQDPLAYEAEDFNLYRYCGNGPTNRTDPTGLRPPNDAHDALMMGWINQAEYNYFKNRSLDELRAYVAKLEAMRALIENIKAIMDKTWVLDFWPGGCQRWLDTFEANLKASGFSNPLVKEHNVGWEPSSAMGGGHAYYYFVLQDGTIIKVDHWIYYGGSRLQILPPKPPSPSTGGSGGG